MILSERPLTGNLSPSSTISLQISPLHLPIHLPPFVYPSTVLSVSLNVLHHEVRRELLPAASPRMGSLLRPLQLAEEAFQRYRQGCPRLQQNSLLRWYVLHRLLHSYSDHVELYSYIEHSAKVFQDFNDTLHNFLKEQFRVNAMHCITENEHFYRGCHRTPARGREAAVIWPLERRGHPQGVQEDCEKQSLPRPCG